MPLLNHCVGPGVSAGACEYGAPGRLAQLVERLLYTQDVGGSSPSSPKFVPLSPPGRVVGGLVCRVHTAAARALPRDEIDTNLRSSLGLGLLLWLRALGFGI